MYKKLISRNFKNYQCSKSTVLQITSLLLQSSGMKNHLGIMNIIVNSKVTLTVSKLLAKTS